MRYFSLSRSGGKPVEESDAGHQLFVQANLYQEVAPGVFHPAPILEKQLPFDYLVAMVAERMAVLDAAAVAEHEAEKQAAAKRKAKAKAA
jgi:hypothetical protein